MCYCTSDEEYFMQKNRNALRNSLQYEQNMKIERHQEQPEEQFCRIQLLLNPNDLSSLEHVCEYPLHPIKHCQTSLFQVSTMREHSTSTFACKAEKIILNLDLNPPDQKEGLKVQNKFLDRNINPSSSDDENWGIGRIDSITAAGRYVYTPLGTFCF